LNYNNMPPKTDLQKLLEKPNPPIAAVEAALATVPNLNEPFSKSLGVTYLAEAAAKIRNIDILKLLVEKGANVNAKDKKGGTPLHDAARFNTLEVVKFLVEKGAVVNAETAHKYTPLYMSVMNTYDDSIAPYLIEKGADVNIQNADGFTPLIQAISFNPEIVKLLIEKGADVNVTDRHKNSPIHHALNAAITSGQYTRMFEILKILVEKGGDINAKDNVGFTPLMIAAKMVYGAIAVYLIEKGANVNDATITGQTPLMLAVEHNRIENVKTLLEKGADKSLKMSDGKTALDFAKTDEMRNLLKEPEVVESTEMFKGFTQSDIVLLNRIFEAPSDISVCPICLEFAERTDGCMYMTHTCRKPHKELFAKYSLNGKVEWCTLCGRVSQSHHHFSYAPPDAPRPGRAPIQPTATGEFRFFDKDCKASGGGGHEEKVRRFNRMLHYACELQTEVGKISETEGRKKLIAETWKGADIHIQNVPKILEQKKFDFPCEFPEDTAPVADVEMEYPDIPKPAGLQPNPIEHRLPDNACIVELGEHDDNRPVFQFIHKQPDGTTTWEHKDEYICGEDLESAIRSRPMDGMCPINPEKCKGKIYPEELKGIASPEFYEVYRKNFNKANAAKTGGAVTNMFNPVVNPECAMPQSTGRKRGREGYQEGAPSQRSRTAGKRKTYRKKKQRKNRKTFKRVHK
jgi:ankyrin repeat protein